ncbi:MAG: hypothetical protein JWM11_840 [Planctomycetaceae bacterium]|nr:hypothetical protein [Planctomycetaceae bacterium]
MQADSSRVELLRFVAWRYVFCGFNPSHFVFQTAFYRAVHVASRSFSGESEAGNSFLKNLTALNVRSVDRARANRRQARIQI